MLAHRPEDFDKRAADMYSFAIILWEVATGKIPFSDLSPMQVGFKVSLMWTHIAIGVYNVFYVLPLLYTSV